MGSKKDFEMRCTLTRLAARSYESLIDLTLCPVSDTEDEEDEHLSEYER